MIRRIRPVHRTIAALALAACAIPQATAQDEGPTEGWKDTAEFSFVVTGGNSDTETLGFKNKLWRIWDRSSFEFKAGGVRAESTTVDRMAVGTPGNFDVHEDEQTELTAESYYLNGRYDHKITDRFFWLVSAGWERNRFAGIDNRYNGAGGVGNIWIDSEKTKFRTDYSVTYTREETVFKPPDDTDDTFAGLRVASAFLHQFGESTTYTNDLEINQSLDDSDDLRADMTNAVAVAINERLALKVSWQILYDAEPAFDEVDLFDTSGIATGETVLVELEEVDTVFTTSLVVNF